MTATDIIKEVARYDFIQAVYIATLCFSLTVKEAFIFVMAL